MQNPPALGEQCRSKGQGRTQRPSHQTSAGRKQSRILELHHRTEILIDRETNHGCPTSTFVTILGSKGRKCRQAGVLAVFLSFRESPAPPPSPAHVLLRAVSCVPRAPVSWLALPCFIGPETPSICLEWMGSETFFCVVFPHALGCPPEMIARCLMQRTQSSRGPPGFYSTVLRSEGSVPPFEPGRKNVLWRAGKGGQ